jgi:hypothetical protein
MLGAVIMVAWVASGWLGLGILLYSSDWPTDWSGLLLNARDTWTWNLEGWLALIIFGVSSGCYVSRKRKSKKPSKNSQAGFSRWARRRIAQARKAQARVKRYEQRLEILRAEQMAVSQAMQDEADAVKKGWELTRQELQLLSMNPGEAIGGSDREGNKEGPQRPQSAVAE